VHLFGSALVLAASACVQTATAGSVVIDGIGGGITLNSGDLSAAVFGSMQPNWSSTSLASVHAALNADGIVTNGKVTTLLADTDHGLALLVLIDNELNGQPAPSDASLHMTSFGHGQNLAYINNIAGNVLITPQSTTSRLATGDFLWDSVGNGDGFGWADLVVGNAMTFRFNRLVNQPLGLDDPGTFQFVTMGSNGWEVANISLSEGSFTSDGQYSFALVVVPLPGVTAMASLPLFGLALSRRRRVSL
jgi:hypothetical protein